MFQDVDDPYLHSRKKLYFDYNGEKVHCPENALAYPYENTISENGLKEYRAYPSGSNR